MGIGLTGNKRCVCVCVWLRVGGITDRLRENDESISERKGMEAKKKVNKKKGREKGEMKGARRRRRD